MHPPALQLPFPGIRTQHVVLHLLFFLSSEIKDAHDRIGKGLDSKTARWLACSLFVGSLCSVSMQRCIWSNSAVFQRPDKLLSINCTPLCSSPSAVLLPLPSPGHSLVPRQPAQSLQTSE